MNEFSQTFSKHSHVSLLLTYLCRRNYDADVFTTVFMKSILDKLAIFGVFLELK